MFLTEADRRLIKLAPGLALPMEIIALLFLLEAPFFGAHPDTLLGWMWTAAELIHWPALPLIFVLGMNPTMWIVLFLVGYIDLVLVFGVALAVFRFTRG